MSLGPGCGTSSPSWSSFGAGEHRPSPEAAVNSVTCKPQFGWAAICRPPHICSHIRKRTINLEPKTRHWRWRMSRYDLSWLSPKLLCRRCLDLAYIPNFYICDSTTSQNNIKQERIEQWNNGMYKRTFYIFMLCFLDFSGSHFLAFSFTDADTFSYYLVFSCQWLPFTKDRPFAIDD